MHCLREAVAGLPNPRPAWYFDVTEQGEGLADTGVHLVDRVHEMLFPEQRSLTGMNLDLSDDETAGARLPSDTIHRWHPGLDPLTPRGRVYQSRRTGGARQGPKMPKGR